MMTHYIAVPRDETTGIYGIGMTPESALEDASKSAQIPTTIPWKAVKATERLYTKVDSEGYSTHGNDYEYRIENEVADLA